MWCYYLVHRCLLRDSSANYGGAMKSGSESIFLITDSTLDSNEASFAGGAINVQSSAHSDLVGVTFLRNKSQRGGAVLLGNSELTISGSTFSRSASLYGGCVYAEDFSRVAVYDTEFKYSSTLLGGVMYVIMSDAHFTESTFKGNSGTEGESLSHFDSEYASFTGDASTGGAFTATLGHLVLHNCLAVNNNAQYGKMKTLSCIVLCTVL